MPADKKKKRRRPKIPGPFRKVVPIFETRLGVVLLVFLCMSAALLLWKSGYTNAAIFEAVAPDSRATGLLNTIPERHPVVLVGEGATRAPNEAKRSKLEDLSSALPKALESGPFKRSGKLEFFPRDQLYVKINGRAEIYLLHDVAGLACTEYESEGLDSPAEVYLYLMETDLGAFGVFQAERDDTAPTAGLGQSSYYIGGSLFFRQGLVYGQVLAGEGWTEEQCKKLSSAILERLPEGGDGEALKKKLSRLPTQGRVANSANYNPKAAFGMDALNGVYQARYANGQDGTLYLWFAEAADVEIAKKMMSGFVTGLGRSAEKLPAPKNEDLADASFFRVGRRFHCIFRWEKLVGGVLDAPDRGQCEKSLDLLMTAIDDADESAAGEGEHK
jgi:Family of unknown function (DUF6599)